MHTYRAALFDLDGTLLDTLDDLADAMNRVLARRGHPLIARDEYRYLVGEGAHRLVEQALPPEARNPEAIRTGFAEYREEYGRAWHVRTKPYDGIPELLDALVARGFALAVLSNKPDDFTRLCVEKLLPRWRFDPVFGQREGVPVKPDPTGALEVARKLGLEPASFLYLGDTGVDMQTARAAGMHAVGVLWGFRDADELQEYGAQRLISHPAEILREL